MFLSHVHETTLTVRNFRRLGVQRPLLTKRKYGTVPFEWRVRPNVSSGQKFVRCRVHVRNVSFSSDRNHMTRLRIGSLSNYDDDDYENVT